MAVQFSLSYDANGDPVLVENTVTGTRKVVSTSPVVSEYKSRFETPAHIRVGHLRRPAAAREHGGPCKKVVLAKL